MKFGNILKSSKRSIYNFVKLYQKLFLKRVFRIFKNITNILARGSLILLFPTYSLGKNLGRHMASGHQNQQSTEQNLNDQLKLSIRPMPYGHDNFWRS